MNNGPLPTRLIFLSDLAATAPGTKVRLLGCIENYNAKTGHLIVQHAYPPPPSQCSRAVVDVNLLLDNMKSNDTAMGEWVNVIGYVDAQPAKIEEKGKVGLKGAHGQAGKESGGAMADTRVQAVMLWSAGAIKLDEYERTVAARIAAEGINRD